MVDDGLTARLVREREALAVRVDEQRRQLDRLHAIVMSLGERLAYDEHILGEMDGVLGTATQLRLEALDERLRGQRLEEVAIAVLREERGKAEVHYREWFELLRQRGHHVGGKNPLGTFLAQINRSRLIERVGRRTGRYRLVAP